MKCIKEELTERLKIYVELMNYVGKDPEKIMEEEIGEGEIEEWYLGEYPIIEGNKVKLVMSDLLSEFLFSVVI